MGFEMACSLVAGLKGRRVGRGATIQCRLDLPVRGHQRISWLSHNAVPFDSAFLEV